MKSGRSPMIGAAVVLAVALFGLPSLSRSQQRLTDAELIATLRKGGYVIYLRHAATDVSRSDENRDNLSDWTKQRNLSDVGRQQAVSIGQAFRALHLPVSHVFSSPYCRCIETAMLAFGKIQVSKDLVFSISKEREEVLRLAEALKVMLGTKPAPGTNVVLVAHSTNLREAAKIWPKSEGGAFIFKPMGNSTFELVDTIEPEKWVQLAARAGTSSDAAKLNASNPDRALVCKTQTAKIQ